MRLNPKIRAGFARCKEEFLDVLYPDDLTCVVCGAELLKGTHRICRRCREAAAEINGTMCVKCGSRFNSHGICPQCKDKCFAFETLVAVYPYDGVVKNAVLNMKDGNKPWLSRWFAECMFDRIDVGVGYDAILYPPSARKTVKRRGYDHMKLVADHLSKLAGIPVVQPFEKSAGGEKQARKGKSERKESADASYFLKDLPQGKRFLLIDDVATTCATLDALSRLIVAANPDAKIDCRTFARTFLKE